MCFLTKAKWPKILKQSKDSVLVKYKCLLFSEATRVVLITVSSVLAAVIICVICVIVVLLCLTKRRKYRSDDSISDVSSMDLPVKANIKA